MTYSEFMECIKELGFEKEFAIHYVKSQSAYFKKIILEFGVDGKFYMVGLYDPIDGRSMSVSKCFTLKDLSDIKLMYGLENVDCVKAIITALEEKLGENL